VTIESTAAQAAALGLLKQDVVLTADLLSQLHDGLSEIYADQAEWTSPQRRLYGLPPWASRKDS